MKFGMTKKEAEKVFDVLAKEAGASYSLKDEFIQYSTSSMASIREFRFMGLLGMGGKFYDEGSHWRVGCYSEDETGGRKKIVEKTNLRLKKLFNSLRPNGHSHQELD